MTNKAGYGPKIMEPQQMTTEAIRIALAVHRGQTCLSGDPYIDHPLRVASRASQLARPGIKTKTRIVAILHDCIEDGHGQVTAWGLLEAGFPGEIVDAVLSVTKRPNEDYFGMIERAGCNEIGRVVKIADLEDNMDIRRLPTVGDRELARIRKYHEAWTYLKQLERNNEID